MLYLFKNIFSSLNKIMKIEGAYANSKFKRKKQYWLIV
ncbi:hypothetical protein SA508_06525 [Aggregatibacter actinomycetemcomitans serotype d str. SA508]|nr:hypothetical protein SA508_06525 [Aggregatibacter actinomycetemcomitans serotype d str. SA508]